MSANEPKYVVGQTVVVTDGIATKNSNLGSHGLADGLECVVVEVSPEWRMEPEPHYLIHPVGDKWDDWCVMEDDLTTVEGYASETSLTKLRELLAGDPWGLKAGDRETPAVTEPEAEVVDMVNSPSHYRSHPKGIECIDVIEDNPFPNLANAIKYTWRVSWGGKWDDLEDLRKAVWYLNRELQRRENQAEVKAA